MGAESRRNSSVEMGIGDTGIFPPAHVDARNAGVAGEDAKKMMRSGFLLNFLRLQLWLLPAGDGDGDDDSNGNRGKASGRLCCEGRQPRLSTRMNGERA